MKTVITYGTYDLMHYGHIRLLERAKELGDYLIVGVTSDSFDKERGKINVSQTVLERVEAVKATGLADKIIVEEYEGQKIDDIIKYNVDIFTVGSDWVGKFDYLNEYCKVVYLDRTSGVSSTEIRSDNKSLRIGVIGNNNLTYKFINEASFVNGARVSGYFSDNDNIDDRLKIFNRFNTVEELMEASDAIYVNSNIQRHYFYSKKALEYGKHVLCESPVSLSLDECNELIDISQKSKLIFMESLKTAYSVAYQRLLLLVKSGIIGDVVSIDSTCTSILNLDLNDIEVLKNLDGSFSEWGPAALLPIFQILGTDYKKSVIVSKIGNKNLKFDTFTKIDLIYNSAVAQIKVGNGVKSEGELIISGTKGYIIVPAPWWKNDYFEVRYENSNDNKKYYYKIDGEGIRYEIVSFIDLIKNNINHLYISREVSRGIVNLEEKILKGDYISI